MKPQQIVDLRNRLGLTQKDFWERIGLTQSAGSRIENGSRGVSGPVEMLIGAIYMGKPLPVYRRR